MTYRTIDSQELDHNQAIAKAVKEKRAIIRWSYGYWFHGKWVNRTGLATYPTTDETALESECDVIRLIDDKCPCADGENCECLDLL